MMNEARLGVAVQGLALSEVAYQNAAIYARDRRQGRALAGAKEPGASADPIIVHPDVRRMLMAIRSFNEAARALMLWTALQGDIAHRAADPADRQAADDQMGLMTPVLKGVLTDTGFANAVLAQQVFGGHGYIAENGMEQFVRDARIITLYEGTTGIQAADLLGRKILQLQGVGFRHFLEEVSAFCQQHAADEALRTFITPLAVATRNWSDLTLKLAARVQGNPEELGAAAVDYQYYSGYVALAYLWARSVAAADSGTHSAAFRQAKRDTATFYFARILPRCLTHQAAIEAGVDTLPSIA